MRRQLSRTKTIVSLIGIDYALLKRSGEANVTKFLITGLLVLAIGIISFVSSFYAFDLMFHRWYAEVLLAVFFALTFLNIYLLLIQTFSKEPLPPGYKSRFLNTSHVARAVFVGMISFLFAQPIRIMVIREKLDQDVESYRESLFDSFRFNNEHLYRLDIRRLRGRMLQIAPAGEGGELVKLREAAKADLAVISSKIAEDNRLAYEKIRNADFFLKRIALSGAYPLSWLACLLVMVIYALPVILIYSISADGNYYKEKIRLEHAYIEHAYLDFKAIYRKIFSDRYGQDVNWYERFDDPPYNWSKKLDPECGSADDLKKALG